MNLFDDMDEAAVLAAQHFADDTVTFGLGARVINGNYTPEWAASTYSSRTKYTSINGKGNSFVEAMHNLIVAVKAFEAATLMQTEVVHVERNVLQLQASVTTVTSNEPF